MGRIMGILGHFAFKVQTPNAAKVKIRVKRIKWTDVKQTEVES